MTDVDFDDPPYIHDYHLSRVEHEGSILRLLLRRRAYSKEQLDFVTVWRGWLTFLDVADVDARPSKDDFDYAPAGGFIDRLFYRIFRPYDVKKLGTVRDLIATISEEQEESGAPLSKLELLVTGYVLETTLAGSYFIRASAARLDESPE